MHFLRTQIRPADTTWIRECNKNTVHYESVLRHEYPNSLQKCYDVRKHEHLTSDSQIAPSIYASRCTCFDLACGQTASIPKGREKKRKGEGGVCVRVWSRALDQEAVRIVFRGSASKIVLSIRQQLRKPKECKERETKREPRGRWENEGDDGKGKKRCEECLK